MQRVLGAPMTVVLATLLLAVTAHTAETADRYKDDGMEKYLRKDYAGAVAAFDRYLANNPDDASMILLRGLSKSLLKPEDVAGACADFLVVKDGLKDMKVEAYCAGQPGW